MGAKKGRKRRSVDPSPIQYLKLEQSLKRAVDQGKTGMVQEMLQVAGRRVAKNPDAQLGAVIERCSAYMKSAAKEQKAAKARKKALLSAEVRCSECLGLFKRKSLGERRCPRCQPLRLGTSVRTVSAGLPGLGRRR